MPNAPLTVAQARRAVDALEAAVAAMDSLPSAFGGPEGSVLVPSHLMGRTVASEAEPCDALEAAWVLVDALLTDARAQLAAAEKGARTTNGSR